MPVSRGLKLFSIVVLILLPIYSHAQYPYLGMQTSWRKSMVSATMNPAEINNLHRKVEVGFFATNALISTNTLSFGQMVNNTNDLWDNLISEASGNIQGTTEGTVMIPSVGIKLNKWSVGLLSQAYISGNIIDINAELGKHITDNRNSSNSTSFGIDNPQNQRIAGSTWVETGLIIGREIWNNNNSKLSLAGNFKMVYPINYNNIGVDAFKGVLIRDGSEITISDARASINLIYNRDLVDFRSLDFDYSNLKFENPSGFGLDLGVNWQLKNERGVWLNSGFAIRNIGKVKFGDNFTSHNFSMNIPEGNDFNIDVLNTDLENVRSIFMESDFFSFTSSREGFEVYLPTVVAINGDMKISEIFYLSFYGQTFIQNKNFEFQIPNANIVSLIPSAIFGKFEVYSPWTYFDISNLTVGLGFRYGGFFIGSQSILSGVIADTNKLDVHAGLNWSFGRVQ